MRISLIILACTLTSVTGLAQTAPNLDHLMKRRVIDCRDIVYNCQALIPGYAHQSSTDSVWLVLQYWVDKCGESERTLRMEILLNLKEKTFYEAHYKNDLLDLLMTYRHTVDNRTYVNNDSSAAADVIRNTYSFDAFTADYARRLTEENDPRTLEYLLCQFYSNNFAPLLKALRDNKIPGTVLQTKYNETVTEAKNAVEGNLALIGEWWIPTQGASILGQHPGLGVQIGLKKNKLMVDLTGILRFVKSPHQYQVFSQNTVMTTRHFQGHYLGLEIGREMWRKGKSEFDLVGGIGYDGFEAIPEDIDAGINAKSINSLNINLGAGYRYYYKRNGQYLSLQPRINAVNYANKRGSDLSGNTISIRLIWGFSTNDMRDEQLDRMGAR